MTVARLISLLLQIAVIAAALAFVIIHIVTTFANDVNQYQQNMQSRYSVTLTTEN